MAFICIVLFLVSLPSTSLYAEINTTSIIAAVPDAPTQLTASAGTNSVDLYWVAPINDGNQPITSYVVQQSTNGVDWIPATVAASLGSTNSSSARVTDLMNGTLYQFRVSAVNLDGIGSASSTVSATPVVNAGFGTTWTGHTAPALDIIMRSVAFGNNTFVAFSLTGANRAVVSTDGINWSSYPTPVDNAWRSIVYGNGVFVGVSANGNGNQAMVSTDGINWTSSTTPGSNIPWSSVSYGNGLFVAVAFNEIMTSPDGITWTLQPSAPENDWTTVTYGNGLFVVLSSNEVITSPDGISWTSNDNMPEADWQSVTYGNGLFVAVANFSNTPSLVMTSTDGLNWTGRITCCI